MDKLKSFLNSRTRGELTLLAILASIAVFAAGIQVGKLMGVAASGG